MQILNHRSFSNLSILQKVTCPAYFNVLPFSTEHDQMTRVVGYITLNSQGIIGLKIGNPA